MKLPIKISISSIILGATTFSFAFLIADNDSLGYKIIVAFISLVVFSASSAASTGVGFGLSSLGYSIYNTIIGNDVYDPEKPQMHIKIFRKRFFIIFLVFTFAVFIKFLTDFLYSKYSAIYLFFTIACGVFNSGFLTNIIARHKKAEYKLVKK